MTRTLMVHITDDLPGRFRQIGLSVAEHVNVVTVWCPVCTARQDYRRVDHDPGWEGAAFLHDNGCAHYRGRLQRALLDCPSREADGRV